MRLEFPGAVYHITARGNERKKIFLNDRNREIVLETLLCAIRFYNERLSGLPGNPLCQRQRGYQKA